MSAEEASISMESAVHLTETPACSMTPRNAPRWSPDAPRSVTRPLVTPAATMKVPASIRSGTTEWSAPRRRRRPSISIRSGCRPLDLRAHLLQEGDEIVDLGLLSSRLDDRVAIRQNCRQHRVLGTHDGDLGEGDRAAPEPAGRLGEVVAVAVLDLRPKSPHGIDVEVHGTPADPIPAGVADDDPSESRQERTQQDEARPHLGRGLERHEEPLRVAGGDLVNVRFAGGRRPRRCQPEPRS